jgi:hypothetical protein
LLSVCDKKKKELMVRLKGRQTSTKQTKSAVRPRLRWDFNRLDLLLRTLMSVEAALTQDVNSGSVIISVLPPDTLPEEMVGLLQLSPRSIACSQFGRGQIEHRSSQSVSLVRGSVYLVISPSGERRGFRCHRENRRGPSRRN